MSQTCPSCLWISSDDAEACERCGEPFSGQREVKLPAGAIGTAAKSIVALFVLVVVAAVLLQRSGDRFAEVWAWVRSGLQVFWVWLLGPDEMYKPYLVAALAVTAVVWVVLWLLARLR